MTSPAPVAYPLGSPTFQGNQLTVDTALKQPQRISRRIADLSLQKFIVDKIFSTPGGVVAGGAVIYEQSTLNDLYTTRDVEQVSPGSEFPIVGSQRPTPKVAEVEKWGGKFFITWEARDRNDIAHFNNQVTQLANTIIRKVNQRAVETLEAAITALGGAGVISAPTPWDQVITAGTNATSATEYPHADFARAQLAADTDELGVTYDLWLLNPAQEATLRMIYGASLGDVLGSYNVTIFSSNRIPNGTAYAVATGEVGSLQYEQGLNSRSWDDADGIEQTWVQSSVRPVMYVTNPYSIKKITGLDV